MLTQNIVSKVVYSMLPFGSEASWYCHHISYIYDNTLTRISKSYKNMKRFKNVIKIIGTLMVLYRKTIEKMYNPDGIFLENCLKKYKNVFKEC